MSRLSDNKHRIDESWAIVTGRYAGAGLMNQSVLSATAIGSWSIDPSEKLTVKVLGAVA
jgi:hypothetical protein